jgi:uncharacterized membrane protein YtjA (UPF0391 family)
MLGWNSIYLFLAVVAGLFGFTGTLEGAADAATFGKFLFGFFLLSLFISEIVSANQPDR